MADVIVGIVHYRDSAAVATLLDSVAGWDRQPAAVLVADNSAATSPSAWAATEVLALPRNLGYGGAANRLLQEARRRGAGRLLLLTQDARLEPDALAALMQAMDEDDAVAVAAPVLRHATDPARTFSAGGVLKRNGRTAHLQRNAPAAPGRRRVERVDWADGACLLLDVAAAEAVGDFDEDYFLYVEEVDLQHRLRRAGRSVVVARGAVAYQSPGSYSRYVYYKYRNATRLTAKFPDDLRPWPWHLALAKDLVLLTRQGRPTDLRWAVRGLVDARAGRTGERPARALTRRSDADPRTPAAPRVLLLTKTDHRVPRDGGSLRVAAIASQLAERGLHLDVVVVRSEGADDRGRSVRDLPPILRVLAETARTASPTSTRWFRPGVVRRLVRLQRRHTYAAVLVEYTQLMIYAPVLRDPLVLDMHNIESDLLAHYARSTASRARALVAAFDATRVRALERRAVHRAAHVSVVSTRDADRLRELAGSESAPILATNGVEDVVFSIERLVSAPIAVFIAHLGWAPNVDAAVWLVEHVWPLVLAEVPDARLQLVGRSPDARVRALGSASVQVVPDVDSTAPFLARAAVATAPLLAAGGTRLKILEALAAGVPVVATPLGALGLEHLASAAVLDVVEDPRGFADALVERLRAVPDTGAARHAVEPYRWPTALAPLIDLVAAHAVPDPAPAEPQDHR